MLRVRRHYGTQLAPSRRRVFSRAVPLAHLDQPAVRDWSDPVSRACSLFYHSFTDWRASGTGSGSRSGVNRCSAGVFIDAGRGDHEAFISSAGREEHRPFGNFSSPTCPAAEVQSGRRRRGLRRRDYSKGVDIAVDNVKALRGGQDCRSRSWLQPPAGSHVPALRSRVFIHRQKSRGFATAQRAVCRSTSSSCERPGVRICVREQLGRVRFGPRLRTPRVDDGVNGHLFPSMRGRIMPLIHDLLSDRRTEIACRGAHAATSLMGRAAALAADSQEVVRDTRTAGGCRREAVVWKTQERHYREPCAGR